MVCCRVKFIQTDALGREIMNVTLNIRVLYITHKGKKLSWGREVTYYYY